MPGEVVQDPQAGALRASIQLAILEVPFDPELVAYPDWAADLSYRIRGVIKVQARRQEQQEENPRSCLIYPCVVKDDHIIHLLPDGRTFKWEYGRVSWAGACVCCNQPFEVIDAAASSGPVSVSGTGSAEDPYIVDGSDLGCVDRGRTRYGQLPYCRNCISRCVSDKDPGHRCVVCQTLRIDQLPVAGSGAGV